MKIYVLDNYDSFTYNLVHYLDGEGAEVIVQRNNEVDFDSINSCEKILLSPGPGLPKDAGALMSVIETYADEKPILGVCLGLQAIAEFYGMQLHNLSEVYHGVEHSVFRVGLHYLLADIPLEFKAGLYHSWFVLNQTHAALDTIAIDDQGRIMALAHPDVDICGVQFHPESIMTDDGRKIVHNWVKKA